jgi:hypothetical protein
MRPPQADPRNRRLHAGAACALDAVRRCRCAALSGLPDRRAGLERCHRDLRSLGAPTLGARRHIGRSTEIDTGACSIFGAARRPAERCSRGPRGVLIGLRAPAVRAGGRDRLRGTQPAGDHGGGVHGSTMTRSHGWDREAFLAAFEYPGMVGHRGRIVAVSSVDGERGATALRVVRGGVGGRQRGAGRMSCTRFMWAAWCRLVGDRWGE